MDRKHICIYCGKQCKSGYSLGGHIVKCKSNPKLVQLELQRSVGKRHPRKLVEYSLNCEKCGVPYMLSLTQYKYSIGAYRKYCSKSCASSRPHSQQTKYKISATNKGTGGCASTPERQQLRRQRISETCKQNKKSGGYRIGSGRCRGSWYQSPIAGRIYCDSSYQLFYAQWLDSSNIIWKRNKIKFPYTYENQQHYYIPDFYLVEQKCYIETKGYKTKKDEAKWKEFPYQLKVLYQKDLNELGMKQWRIASNGG